MKRKIDGASLASNNKRAKSNSSSFATLNEIDVVLDCIFSNLPLVDLLVLRLVNRHFLSVVENMTVLECIREVRNFYEDDDHCVNYRFLMNVIGARIKHLEFFDCVGEADGVIEYRVWDYEEIEGCFGRVCILRVKSEHGVGHLLLQFVATPEQSMSSVYTITGHDTLVDSVGIYPNVPFKIFEFNSENEETNFIISYELVQKFHDMLPTSVFNQIREYNIFEPIDNPMNHSMFKNYMMKQSEENPELTQIMKQILYDQTFGKQLSTVKQVGKNRLRELCDILQRKYNNSIDIKSSIVDTLTEDGLINPDYEEAIDQMIQKIVKLSGGGVTFLSNYAFFRSQFQYIISERERVTFTVTLKNRELLSIVVNFGKDEFELLPSSSNSSLQSVMNMEHVPTVDFYLIILGVGFSFGVKHFSGLPDTFCEMSESNILEFAIEQLNDQSITRTQLVDKMENLSDDSISENEEQSQQLEQRYVLNILQYLTPKEWQVCAQVCSFWSYVASLDELWQPYHLSKYRNKLPLLISRAFLERKTSQFYKFCSQFQTCFPRTLETTMEEIILTTDNLSQLPEHCKQHILNHFDNYYTSLSDLLAGEESVDFGCIWWQQYTESLTSTPFNKYTYSMGDATTSFFCYYKVDDSTWVELDTNFGYK